jgi:hypothetical protein
MLPMRVCGVVLTSLRCWRICAKMKSQLKREIRPTSRLKLDDKTGQGKRSRVAEVHVGVVDAELYDKWTDGAFECRECIAARLGWSV